MSLLPEMFAAVDMYGSIFQDESHIVPAVVARWKLFTVNARHIVLAGMVSVVNNLIDSRVINDVSRLVFCSHIQISPVCAPQGTQNLSAPHMLF